ncbi:hypothetical protein MMC06_001133 [Schaereria dolodes]|nr:hypothetical protein [Schaereria dolodes]
MTTLQSDSLDDDSSSFSSEVSSPSQYEDSLPPPPPAKDVRNGTPASPNSVESSIDPLSLSRTNSIYSLSRISFSSQLSQLATLNLPQASSFSSNISSLPTALAAAKDLGGAAAQIQKWIQKAAEVLRGLDAEDDVEWAAAGGRTGLGEVDSAVGRFEGLVGVYVTAIEELQCREDIIEVSADELKDVVDQMERTLQEWNNVRILLKGVKLQVELAMEWQELWGVVLGDIGLEMDNLGRLVFEMEEKRHRAMNIDSMNENTPGLDIQELETIIEESPMAGTAISSHRFSLPPAFSTSSPLQSPGMPSAQDDSSLLALFARMQPLRASLDFLPMRLSTFQSRAEDVLPTACQELVTRRDGLEARWKQLESDAERLRRELGEDRWILVFRNAGRQAQKMCESVQRSLNKLQDSIDSGSQHSNPPSLAKKIESYEAKKIHYGPAIQRVLAIIEKGVKDRVTVNGEILRVQTEMQGKWAKLEAEMKEIDLMLDDISMNKSQQLRDSISTIVSNDRSTLGSAFNTPGSSPASSVVMGPSSIQKGGSATPSLTGLHRQSNYVSSNVSRPNGRRNFTTPSISVETSSLPRHSLMSRSVTHSSSTIRVASPCRSARGTSSTPTPLSRAFRPSANPLDGKPRWNSSPKVDYSDLGQNFKPKTPSPHYKMSLPARTSRSSSCYTSSVPLPSPLSREASSSPCPLTTSLSRPRTSVAQSGSFLRGRRQASPSPTRSSNGSIDISHERVPSQTYPLTKTKQPSHRRQSFVPVLSPEPKYTEPASIDGATAIKPRTIRPATAMASTRRSSMLPQPKARAVSGTESVPRTVSASRRDSITFMNGEERRWR